jgi:gliding motility-associated-like protein
VVASNGSCNSSASVPFSIDAKLTTPAIPTITITPATCLADGKAIINNYVAGVIYNFNPSGPTVSTNGAINGLTLGSNYTVTASNSTCTSGSSTAFSIDEQLPFPAPTFAIDTTSGCTPLNYNLTTTAIQGIQYQWFANGNNIGNSSSISNSIATGGCYDITLTISNALGCTATTTMPNLICALQSPKALFSANPKTISANPQTVNFTNNSTGADTYLWDLGNGTTSSAINPSVEYKDILQNNFVTLHAYSNNGCADSISIILYYKEETLFYIPNSFTPDQDEFNQTWGPVFTSGFDPFNFDMYVFDRWGNLIWESHDADSRWDGTYGAKGVKVPQGIYTYKINYKPKETDKKLYVAGHINLIR